MRCEKLDSRPAHHRLGCVPLETVRSARNELLFLAASYSFYVSPIRPYSLLFNNCEHFTRYCATGKRHCASSQVVLTAMCFDPFGIGLFVVVGICTVRLPKYELDPRSHRQSPRFSGNVAEEDTLNPARWAKRAFATFRNMERRLH